jgi:hypothetical protein
LVTRARARNIELRVPAIAGSERQKGHNQLEDFGVFKERLARAGLPDARLLLPMGYPDLCYYDRCVYSGPELEVLERRIQEILFPTIPYDLERDPAENVKFLRKWRNAKCDVQAMWCHIHYGGDVFVTRDSNFLRSKKRPLELIGAGMILLPEEALIVLGA